MEEKEYRTITCTNSNGYSIIFTETSLSPFVITDCDGLYNIIYNVNLQENGNSDGASISGHTMKYRNIVLEVTDNERYANHREMLSRLFSLSGTLEYDDGVHNRKINYTVEKVTGLDGTFYKRTHQISLICENPYFTDIEDNNVVMSSITPLFEFPHEFVEEEISRIERVQNLEIDNQNGSETGMTITIEALGSVLNPSISILESGEHMTVGISGKKDFTLENGQKLIITTLVDDCHVYLLKSRQKEEINMYLPSSADFIRLQPGTNHIGYTAESGEENMTVSISFRRNYVEA